MARIEFPIATQDGELFQHEGVLYQYKGTPPAGFWAANSKNTVIDTFVDAAGDVMSGDLVLSKLAGSGSAGVGVDATGKLLRTDSQSDLTSPFVNLSGDTLTGSLDFTNTLGDITLSLSHTGSGTFIGDIRSGEFNVSTTESPTSSGGGIVSGSVYAKRSDSNSLAVFTGYNISGNASSVIYGDGGAEFGGGNISLTSTGTVAGSNFIADGPYQSSAGIRQIVKDENLTIGKVVQGNGTTAIGGTLAAFPSAGSPNILLSEDGTISAGNISCTGINSAGTLNVEGANENDFFINGELNGDVTLSITAGGSGTLKDITVEAISGGTANFSTSLVTAGVTVSATGISIQGDDPASNAIELTNTGRGTFAGDVHLSGTLFAGDISVSGSVSAGSFGAVAATTGTFSGDVSASGGSFTGDITANDISASNINASDVTLTGSLTGDLGATFANQKISFTDNGSITTHAATAGIEIGVEGTSYTTAILTGIGNSTSAGEGTTRFNFTADGAASLASGSLTISIDGNMQNINNSYGAISDRKFKEDITPAQSQWDDVLAVELVNYSFKPELGWGTGRRLGVISQDLRRICPALVDVQKEYKKVTTPVFDSAGMPVVDTEGDQVYETITQETGGKTESVKYSVLYLKALGALQEVMKRVEKLESQQD